MPLLSCTTQFSQLGLEHRTISGITVLFLPYPSGVRGKKKNKSLPENMLSSLLFKAT